MALPRTISWQDNWKVTITDTKMAVDLDKSKYTYYNIMLRYNQVDPPIYLTRRFRQFLALHKKLTEASPQAMEELLGSGTIFPKKKFFGRFEETFVEDRRQRLEEYLQKVVIHEELASLDCVKAFFNPLINELGKTTSNPQLSRNMSDFLLS